MSGRWRTAFLFALLLLPAILYAGDRSPLRGKPFSDPAEEQVMGDTWNALRVRHPAEHDDADIVINLSQQFYEVMAKPIREYGRSKGLKIVVLKGTCGLSAGMLHKKEADIGTFCCPPGKADRLPGLRFHTIGIHPISIITHPENSVDSLTTEEVREIFQGKINNWSTVGGENSLVRVVARFHCRKRPGHWSLILKEPDLFSVEAREVGAIEDMFALVAETRASIGYEVVRTGSSYGGDVKILKVNEHHPDNLESLVAGSYPFYRVLSVTTWEEEHGGSELSADLVAFIIESIEKNGAESGFVSVAKLKESGWIFTEDELTGEPP